MGLRAALGLTLGLAVACGGGGTNGPSPAPPAPAPAWQTPVDLVATGYASGATLAGDGQGGVVAAWMRTGVDGGGTSYWEQAAARLNADGTWGAPVALAASSPTNTFQDPVLKVDAQGKGMLAWLSSVPRQTTTVLRTVAVDLTATSPFGTRQDALLLDLKAPSGLHLEVGRDGSAFAAWAGSRTEASTGLEFATVQTSRREGTAAWTAPQSFALNQFSHQLLHDLVGDGRGAYVLDFSSGDDAFLDAFGLDVPAAPAPPSFVPGWQPAAQYALPVGHPSVWAQDGGGGLETWLLYGFSGEGDPLRQAWPRQRSATGTWTVADKVILPKAAQNLALFREADGRGWVAGLGTEGLWAAPLQGLALGSPITLLPAPTTTEVMVGVRDASGRPALLWIQRGAGGTYEGVGFSHQEGPGWSTPVILPGTAGRTIQRLMAVAGPSGLLAGWVEVGTRVLLFRTALWR